MLQVRGHIVQEAALRVGPAQGQPQDHLQGELQVWGPAEVPGKPGGYGSAVGRGVLEVGWLESDNFSWNKNNRICFINNIGFSTHLAHFEKILIKNLIKVLLCWN